MSRKQSFFWITLAYIFCIGAGSAYLIWVAEVSLWTTFVADLVATVVIFIFSRLFKNSSFYDAYWSVIPPLVLVLWWTFREGDGNAMRYILISIVVWYWAIRLTWNWAKHWPGMQHEDWRYPLLKQKQPKLEFIVDWSAIHFFPTCQVFLGMLPFWVVANHGERALNWLDGLAFIAGISAVTIQLISDRQLHQFLATRKPGQIIDSGMWGWSRHPNYFGELLFWTSLALFGLAAYPEGWYWLILGAVAMLAMFLFASIPMMEERSLERRPEYQRIINRVSMLIPLPPKRSPKGDGGI